MIAEEIRVELLLGCRVFAQNGRSVGRIEEVCADRQGAELVVTEFLIGTFAAFDRLSAWNIGRTVLDLFSQRSKHGGYRVPWSKLDLSNPARPRLTCRVEDLVTLV
jgi:sporulation protein YlmC with PRC-barrel domain